MKPLYLILAGHQRATGIKMWLNRYNAAHFHDDGLRWITDDGRDGFEHEHEGNMKRRNKRRRRITLNMD